MNPGKIIDATNNVPQKRVLYSENPQEEADYSVLTPDQIEHSKLINAEFYVAAVQVPNSYVKNADGVNEPVYDHSNPVFKDFDMVRVVLPEKDSGGQTIVDQYVTSFHIKRWPERWRAFKSGQSQGVDGVSITELTSIPQAAITRLQAAGVFTIEQLASHSSPGSLVHNGAIFQSAARKFLSGRDEGKAQRLEDEVQELKAQLAELLASSKAKSAK